MKNQKHPWICPQCEKTFILHPLAMVRELCPSCVRENKQMVKIREAIHLQPVDEPLSLNGAVIHRVGSRTGDNRGRFTIYHILQAVVLGKSREHYLVVEREKSRTYSYSLATGVFGWKRNTFSEIMALLETFLREPPAVTARVPIIISHQTARVPSSGANSFAAKTARKNMLERLARERKARDHKS